MAMASPKVRSTSIECREFTELAGQYEVYSVPKMVVNDEYHFVGGLPESEFVDAVLAGAHPQDDSTA